MEDTAETYGRPRQGSHDGTTSAAAATEAIDLAADNNGDAVFLYRASWYMWIDIPRRNRGTENHEYPYYHKDHRNHTLGLSFFFCQLGTLESV